MIKQNQGKLNAVHIIMDVLISSLSCVVSYYILYFFFNTDIFIEDQHDIRIMVGLPLIVAVTQILCNRACDLYRSYRSTAFIHEAVNILKSGLAVFAIIILGSMIFSSFWYALERSLSSVSIERG